MGLKNRSCLSEKAKASSPQGPDISTGEASRRLGSVGLCQLVEKARKAMWLGLPPARPQNQDPVEID